MKAVAGLASSCRVSSLRKMGGRRTFLLVNLVVVLLNAGLGILVNLTAFTTRTGLRHRYLTLPSDHANISLSSSSLSGGEVLPAAFGVVDVSGNYTTHTFVWPAQEWAVVTAESRLCLTTQASVEHLFWLAWQSETWTGPMSVSIFVPGSDYAVAAAMVSYLRRCFPNVQERASFHLVHPRTRPPLPSPHPELLHLSCEDPEEANNILLHLRDENEMRERRYPQNLMRNLARRTCPCEHTLTIDIDMLTPPYMAENLTGFLTEMKAGTPCWKCAYVVPVYELAMVIPYPPDDKIELLRLLLKGMARRFHVQVFAKNQGNSHLQYWEVEPSRTSASHYRVLYNITTYEEFWEPILVLPYTAPLFDERFVGYGFTRNSQVYELHCRGYHFQVLDRAFLTHRGFQTTSTYPPSRYAQIEINRVRYQMFKRELHARLGLPAPPALKVPPLRQQLPAILARKTHPRLPSKITSPRKQAALVKGKN
ncbi:beta-1,4-glucuronyltransferase 1-like [Panulirus ornatus]|uniref:beta-1,4-glucuronyltransferase 1-like n=1 Tax=Panulirus ornatus TaxID=150431 RepID=UPI003A877522